MNPDAPSWNLVAEMVQLWLSGKPEDSSQSWCSCYTHVVVHPCLSASTYGHPDVWCTDPDLMQRYQSLRSNLRGDLIQFDFSTKSFCCFEIVVFSSPIKLRDFISSISSRVTTLLLGDILWFANKLTTCCRDQMAKNLAWRLVLEPGLDPVAGGGAPSPGSWWWSLVST